MVEGDPALLGAVDNANRDLIVVGNRGLGASAGQLLGSVPEEVVSPASCDVLIVQTTPAATPAVRRRGERPV